MTPGEEQPGADRARRARRVRRARGRPLVAGLALSALAHLLGLVAYSFSTGPAPEGPMLAARPATATPGGTQIVRLLEVGSSLSTDPQDPVQIEDPEQPAVQPQAPVLEDGLPEWTPLRYRSAAERLRAGDGDARLWMPLDPGLVELTAHEILELEIKIALEAMSDSAAAQAERARMALDWTRTDDDGNRWGVSPGRIHLGKITVPLPFGFGPPPDYSGDRADMAFRIADIDRAAGSIAARRSWKERAEIMRRRREERRKAEEEEAAGKVRVRPDTLPAASSRSR